MTQAEQKFLQRATRKNGVALEAQTEFSQDFIRRIAIFSPNLLSKCFLPEHVLIQILKINPRSIFFMKNPSSTVRRVALQIAPRLAPQFDDLTPDEALAAASGAPTEISNLPRKLRHVMREQTFLTCLAQTTQAIRFLRVNDETTKSLLTPDIIAVICEKYAKNFHEIADILIPHITADNRKSLIGNWGDNIWFFSNPTDEEVAHLLVHVVNQDRVLDFCGSWFKSRRSKAKVFKNDLPSYLKIAEILETSKRDRHLTGHQRLFIAHYLHQNGIPNVQGVLKKLEKLIAK